MISKNILCFITYKAYMHRKGLSKESRSKHILLYYKHVTLVFKSIIIEDNESREKQKK